MRARLHQGLLAIRTHWSAWRTAVLLLGMLGFGLLAVLGAYSYIQERVAVERARLGVGQERIEVLVAARALQRGEAVSTDNLAVRALPREILPGGALSPSRMDAIQGLRLQWPMQPGEPLLASAVFAAESAGLSSRLKHGVRALTIAVDETNAISGLLQPGDRIDLLLSWRPTPLAGVALPELTRTVMQDVVVI
ncbi:MAG: Flp pilus assembly protein CpaB, partial [Burkholderiales bacterium]